MDVPAASLGAESQTQSRLSSALGAFGTGIQVATSVAHKAADLGSDILGQAGVGSPGYSMTPTDERSNRGSSKGGSSSDGPSDSDGASGSKGWQRWLSERFRRLSPRPRRCPVAVVVASQRWCGRMGERADRSAQVVRWCWSSEAASPGCGRVSSDLHNQAGPDPLRRVGQGQAGLAPWAWAADAGSPILLGGAPLLIAFAGAHQWLLALGWMPAWAVLIVLVTVPVRGRSACRWAADSLDSMRRSCHALDRLAVESCGRCRREVRRSGPARCAVGHTHPRRAALWPVYWPARQSWLTTGSAAGPS